MIASPYRTMEVQRERTELLSSRSPNTPIKHAPGLLSPPLMAEDKDSIYTFTDNCKSEFDNESIDKCTMKSSPLSNDMDSVNQSSDTQSPSQSLSALKKAEVSVTDTPSSSPLQMAQQSVMSIASPTHFAAEQAATRPNGSISSAAERPPTAPRKVLSGKPKAFAAATQAGAAKASAKTVRARPKPKRQVPMYQSQLNDKDGIKIRFKKSPLDAAVERVTAAMSRKRTSSATSGSAKSSKKRQRKSKYKGSSDSDDSEYEKRRRNNNLSSEKQRSRKSATATTSNSYIEPVEQSAWGSQMPPEILLRIFEIAVSESCLPTIVNIGKVCSLWRKVSLEPKLWHTLDLSSYTKDRNELKLKWIIQNHMQGCKDVNLGTPNPPAFPIHIL